ncbi:MAG: hypothetical protein WC358_10500, partial [Ignavibacteria bacterium]
MKTSLHLNYKNIFIFLFVTFIIIGNSFAQTPQYYNLNTGGTTTSYPFNVAEGKAINYIFLSGDFNKPTSLPSGTQITTVYFFINSAGTRTFTDLRILMAQDTNTRFTSSAFYNGPYDTVYYNASVSLTGTAGGWMSVTLNKPFIYDPNKSLILFVGQCGATGSGLITKVTATADSRRVWSVGGCPFVATSSGSHIQHFGVDVTPVSLSGTYSIPSGSFPTIASAVTALNTYGIAGAVTFNVAAGYTETAPVEGFKLGSDILNATTSSTNKIIFQKSDAGANPLVTAQIGVSTTIDGIWIIQGTDYVTINGIDLQESASNTTTITQMEWGYALLKRNSTAPFDGCQNNTIQNCTITLNKTNTVSKGIYVNNHTALSTSTLTITDVSDANSYNKFYSNTISNVYTGIYVYGYNNASYYDLNNYIGYTSGTGNTITNFGGSSSNPYGIYAVYQSGIYVSYNNINGGTGNTGTIYGIATGTATDVYVRIRYNTITLTPSTTTNSVYAI